MKLKGNPPKHGEEFMGVLDEIWVKSHDLLDECNTLAEDGQDYAEKKNEAARAKAKAFLQSSGKNKEEREANADAFWSKEREAMDLAEEKKIAQLERVRSLRQILSALQTIANSSKAEADAFHYGQTE